MSALLGSWLAASPWILGFGDDGGLLLAATATGAALFAAALGALTQPRAWEEWDVLLVGGAAAASPWMIAPESGATIRASFLVAGAAACLLAGWSLLTDRRRPIG